MDRIKIKSTAKKFVKDNFLETLKPYFALWIWIFIFSVLFAISIVLMSIPHIAGTIVGLIFLIGVIFFAVIAFGNWEIKCAKNYINLNKDEKSLGFSEYFNLVGSLKPTWSLFCSALLKALLSAILLCMSAYVSIRYMFTNQIIADNAKAKPKAILEHAPKITSNKFLDLAIVKLSFILWNLLIIVTLGIAALFVLPYKRMTKTKLYHTLTAELKEKRLKETYFNNLWKTNNNQSENSTELLKSICDEQTIAEESLLGNEIITCAEYLDAINTNINGYIKCNSEVNELFNFSTDGFAIFDSENFVSSFDVIVQNFANKADFTCSAINATSKKDCKKIAEWIKGYKALLREIKKFPDATKCFDEAEAKNCNVVISLIKEDIITRKNCLIVEKMKVKKSFFKALFGIRISTLKRYIKKSKNQQELGQFSKACLEQLTKEKPRTICASSIVGSIVTVAVVTVILCSCLIAPISYINNGILYQKIDGSYIVKENKATLYGEVVIDEEYRNVKVTEIGDNAFEDNYLINTVKMSKSLKTIGKAAFKDCIAMDKVVFSESIANIGKDAFNGCVRLRNIEIPNSVKTIGEYAFSWCSSLETAKLSNSLLYLQKGTFLSCTYLQSVEMGQNMISIGEAAFQDCVTLNSIIIYSRMKTIANYAFSNCINLQSIYYYGNQTDWSQINVSDNTIPSRATVYFYSERRPSSSGNYWHYVNKVPTRW